MEKILEKALQTYLVIVMTLGIFKILLIAGRIYIHFNAIRIFLIVYGMILLLCYIIKDWDKIKTYLKK
jgi:capsule polysaccharide export protein KpsE/RkpR